MKQLTNVTFQVMQQKTRVQYLDLSNASQQAASLGFECRYIQLQNPLSVIMYVY